MTHLQHPVRTVLELSPRDPIVNVRVVFLAGSADDPMGREGLAALTVELMRQATTKLTAAQLADALFPWAAELDVQADKDTVVFVGRVHQDHASAFADVFLAMKTMGCKEAIARKAIARVQPHVGQGLPVEDLLRRCLVGDAAGLIVSDSPSRRRACRPPEPRRGSASSRDGCRRDR